MDCQFSYLTPADFDWCAQSYGLFDPRLTALAYQRFLAWFKAKLSEFPEFHSNIEDKNNTRKPSKSKKNSKQPDIFNMKRKFKKPCRCREPNEPEDLTYLSEGAVNFIRNSRSALNAVPGHLGDMLRSRMFAELECCYLHNKETVGIKTSILLHIFGHEDLSSLSLDFPELSYLLPENKIFDTLAFTCANLKELSINVESLTTRYDCEQAYYWKPLEKLTSLESLIIIGGKLPSDWNTEMKLKTLKFLKLKGEEFSSYKICAALLRPEFKDVADLLAFWASTRVDFSDMNYFVIKELLQCAGNVACLQPLCRTLTTLTIEKTATKSFWQPASAAFLLLACPNLRNFHTTDAFPYYLALRLLRKRKIPSPETFNLTQMYVILQHKENVRAMFEATPHCRELIIEGPCDDDWATEDPTYDSDVWFRRLIKGVGEKAPALSVTYRLKYKMYMNELAALSSFRHVRLQLVQMDLMAFFECDVETSFAIAEKEPVLKNLRKLIPSGCWKDSLFGEAPLLVQCPNVEELYFECVHLCKTGKELVEFARQYWKHLKILYIKSMEGFQWNVDDMRSLLKACAQLRILVLPHSLLSLRKNQKKTFAELHTFAEQRGVQVRYALPEKRKLYCGADLSL